MCKYCQVENREVLKEESDGLLYIMNNLGMAPQLVYSSSGSTKINYCLISYCPICGTKLADYENLHIVKYKGDKNEN